MYFSALTISVASMWMLFLGLKFYVISKRKWMLHGQLSSLRLSSGLKGLLLNVQKHRGMVLTFSKGDVSFRRKILDIQRAINDSLGALAAMTAADPAYAGELRDIVSDWKRLEQAVWALSTESGFAEQSRLIDQILKFMAAVAEQNQLQSNTGCPAEAVNITWQLIPAMAETLGRARAVGSGIAAAGESKALERIKLGFLIQKLKTSMQTVEARIQSAACRDPALKTGFTSIRQELGEFIGRMETKLLFAATPALGAGEFFDQATVVLNSVYALYDTGEAAVLRGIETAIAEVEGSTRINLGSALICGLLVSISSFFS